MGVLVERTSRLVLLAKMEDATAASALAGFTAKLNSIAEPMRQSLTYDQGKEMTRHAGTGRQTGVQVYFCDPHSPWQRGTCENTNGLLRQYMPKGTDLCVYSQEELDAIADSMNNRPRATHRWHTPLEVFARTLAAHLIAPTQPFNDAGGCCTSVLKPPRLSLAVPLADSSGNRPPTHPDSLQDLPVAQRSVRRDLLRGWHGRGWPAGATVPSAVSSRGG